MVCGWQGGLGGARMVCGRLGRNCGRLGERMGNEDCCVNGHVRGSVCVCVTPEIPRDTQA